MNMILRFLTDNRQRFGLERYGATGRLSSLVITPRFQASSHVVFLVWGEASANPVLVAKTPRLKNATASLHREVSNLRLVQSGRQTALTSVPQVVAYEPYHDYPVLIETALNGQAMDPAYTRRHYQRCCDTMTTWLIDLQQRDDARQDGKADWFAEQVERPIRYFRQRFPVNGQEVELLARTEALLAPLRGWQAPLVFEHGDLSHPNLLILPGGEPGVLDWELANPHGLPACDLFLFLTYVAFARHEAQSGSAYQAAVQEAFFTPTAWTSPYVRRYGEALALPTAMLTPLFVLTWLRYIVTQLVRLDDGHYRDEADITQCTPATAQWLRQNRYYALWRTAVHEADKLRW